jgi:hypothetical protein
LREKVDPLLHREGDLRNRWQAVANAILTMRPELLDSARHKLRLAHYHAAALLRVLEQHPTEDLDDPRRIAMEAHLEGLAFTGTAAAEKTLRPRPESSINGSIPIARSPWCKSS